MMKSPIAKEVLPYLVPAVIGTVVAFFVHVIAGITGVIVCVYLVYFFRDPIRYVPDGEGIIVSPADGKIVGVDVVDEPSVFKEKVWKISIFLNIFNVHINYAPVAGSVISIAYQKGKFLPANIARSSLLNENTMIAFCDSQNRTIGVRQIAGLIARRIVCSCAVGDVLEQGEKIGLIKFSSRVELYLPLTCKVVVKNGDMVKGKISIMGLYG